jgi:hypothetical protein
MHFNPDVALGLTTAEKQFAQREPGIHRRFAAAQIQRAMFGSPLH